MNFITILGFAAAACTTIAFLPQAIKAIRTKQTKDLSLGMYSLLSTGVLLWFIYGVLKDDLPIVLANGITLIFAATILILKLKHK